MTQSTETAIRNIKYLCEEAIDHELTWKQFCNLLKDRVEIETAFVEIDKRLNTSTR